MTEKNPAREGPGERRNPPASAAQMRSLGEGVQASEQAPLTKTVYSCLECGALLTEWSKEAHLTWHESMRAGA